MGIDSGFVLGLNVRIESLKTVMEKHVYKEEERLRALSCDDMKAFDAIFIEYFPKIKRFLSGFLDSTDAEDLSQDLFVKLWQNRSILIGIENLNAYLYRVAKNTLYSYLERTLKAETSPIETYSDISTSEALEETLFAKELEELIDLTIERMPCQRKTIFIMSRKEGLTNQEIAERLTISKRTVETHISAALSDIRKVLSLLLLFF